MKEELTKKIQDLREVCKEEGLVISHDTLFKEACTFLRGELMSKKKQSSNYNPNKKASANQLAYAQTLADKKGISISVSEDTSNKEISELIKELKK